MKVKVDGMREKTDSSATLDTSDADMSSTLTSDTTVCYTDTPDAPDLCTPGHLGHRGGQMDRQVPYGDMEIVVNNTHGGAGDTLAREHALRQRTVAHSNEVDFEELDQEMSDGETSELPDSQTKPIPPPRSDSHGSRPRARQMVDTLGALHEEDDAFAWDMHREYLLSCMGFVNGIGCLLKSATLILKHGGGVFFIAYVIFIVIIGCPLVYMESTLGQYADGGAIAAWKVLPMFSGLGYSMIVLSCLLSTFYAMEVTWAVYYFGVTIAMALSNSTVPWQYNNVTDTFREQGSSLWFNISGSNAHEANTSYLPVGQLSHSNQYLWAIQYFYSSILELSDSMDNLIDYPVWYIALCLLFVWVCVYACLLYGAGSIGKIMYVLAPYPYLAFAVLLVVSSFNDGSVTGIRYFLRPIWHKLAAVEIWYDAGSLVFYTLSLGTGCLHTLAGYTHFHSHCYRNLILICICNVMAVMVGGLAICSGMGILADITNTTLHNMSLPTEYELGYGLYPYILTQLSNSTAMCMLYFSAIFVIGLSSLIVYVQTIITGVLEILLNCGISHSRMRRWMVQIALCVMFFVIGLLFTTKTGLYAVHFLDCYVCRVSPYIIVLLECVLLMYMYGAQLYLHNIEDMTGQKNSPWWKYNWKFVSPGVILALISCSLLFPVQLTYRDMEYPDWSEILGWCLSLLPLLCVPVIGLGTMLKAHGTYDERVKACLLTPSSWGPTLLNHQDHDDSAPDYVICHPDNHRPMHGLAMLTANLYIPQLTPFAPEDVPAETCSSEMTGGYMSDLMTITSSDSLDSGPENEQRGNWRGKLEFVLSCLGYVVGLGNIWRFPYLVYRNGGGAFFFPYLIMLLFCGVPLVYMEMAFGQYASLGPVTIWRALPLFKGVGYAMVFAVSIISVYYNIVNAWAFHYLFSSFTTNLPWASCDNSWNTEVCRMNKYAVTNCLLVNSTYVDSPIDSISNHTCTQYLYQCVHTNNQTSFPQKNTTECIKWLHDIFGENIYLPERKNILSRLKDPSEEYFYNKVLNQTSGLHELGGIQWQLALYLLLCWAIVFLCLVKGIYSAGKVAYFVVIIPVILLVVLLICSLLVEGHLDGIRFYVTPKWDQFLSLRVWSDAASQVFFSLSACSGGLTTLSSYNKFRNNIYRDALLICMVDTLMSVLAGFTVFSSMGILAHQLNTTIENVITTNTGLVFVAFPAAVTNFQPAAMWSAFFFLMIVMMGMSSILVMTEIIVTVVMDEGVEVLRKSRILVLLVICFILFLLGLPLTTRSGAHLVELLDGFCGGIPSVIVGLFMCVGLAWVYKVRHFCADIRLMIGRPVSWWWQVMWCVVSPAIMMFILVSSILSGVDLDKDRFPPWCWVMGTSITVLTVISIPIYAIKKLCSVDGTFCQRVREACLAEDNWGPALVKHWKHVEYYPAVNTHTMSVDVEQSPVHAISDRVNFQTETRLPKLSEESLISHNFELSPRKHQELRQRAILNHAYSNPQCNISNGSIDRIKSQLSLQETACTSASTSDVLVVMRKKTSVKTHTVATQTDTRSYTLALKQGKVKPMQEIKTDVPIADNSNCTKPKTTFYIENHVKSKTNSCVKTKTHSPTENPTKTKTHLESNHTNTKTQTENHLSDSKTTELKVSSEYRTQTENHTKSKSNFRTLQVEVTKF